MDSTALSLFSRCTRLAKEPMLDDDPLALDLLWDQIAAKQCLPHPEYRIWLLPNLTTYWGTKVDFSMKVFIRNLRNKITQQKLRWSTRLNHDLTPLDLNSDLLIHI